MGYEDGHTMGGRAASTPRVEPPDDPTPAAPVQSGVPSPGQARRVVPLWWFVLVSLVAAVLLVLWIGARSDLNEANGRLDDIDRAAAALPDLEELGREHLDGVGVIDESSEEHLSATFIGPGLDDLEDLLDELGFSPAVIDRIGNTRALDGTQSAEAPHVIATWTYHPDDGLGIVLERTD